MTEEPGTEIPVTAEPTLDVTTQEPVVTVEATVDAPTVAPESTEAVDSTPETTIEAAVVPTFIFPNPNVKGTINVAKFACIGRTTTIFDIDVFAAAGTLPSGPGACTPTSGIFTFVFVGGLPNASQLMVQNAGSIDLPAGTYDVTDEASGTHATVTIGGGQVSNIMVFGPAVGAPATITPGDGTVSVAVVSCTNVTSTKFDIDTFSAAAATVDCTNSSAKVTFYMVGDGTADYVQRVFSGSGSISLRPGVYEIVVEDTHTHKFITVTSNKVLSMVIMKPLAVAGGAVSGAGEGAETVNTPVPTVAPVGETPETSVPSGSDTEVGGAVETGDDLVAAGTGSLANTDVRSSDTATSRSVDTAASGASETQAAPDVTKLPKAGSGPASQSEVPMAWMLLSASCLLFALGHAVRTQGR
ncbi:MAG: hypothetical protein QM753_05460 [Thermomicrobiales bacterium]